MRFSQPKKEEISLGISIAPLIDIVFLLLIFFMLTSHFETVSGIDIQLPEVSRKGSDQLPDSLVVVIVESGDCYVKGKKLELKELYSRLQKMKAGQERLNLVLQADRDVKHGHVVRVMDMAKRAGVGSILIAAQWESEKVY